jgi:predicted nucleotidyltransferase/nicotinamide mononucleotide adenylyltransferase
MDFKQIGKLIGEEVANEPAIGFYPGGFKPPHKGHFAAAKQLAAKPYINQVKVLIGQGLRGGITAEQSKAIWDLYLKAEPNPKISVEISPDNSPIKYLFTYFADLDNKGYVAGGKKEIESGYFDNLKNKFADRVMSQVISDEFTDKDGERVSGTEFRATISELGKRYQELKQEQKGTTEYTVKLNDYNNTYEYLKSLMPESVINKGLFDDVLKVLNLGFPIPKSLQEIQPNPKNQPQYVWLEEDRWLEEYKNLKKFNPAVFDGENLDSKVKELLLKIATYFWETLELEEPFEDVTLTGSSANYNYTPYSDIDLHILIDFNKFENPELIKKYFDSKKIIFNDKHDPKLGKQPIEVYVQDTNEPHTSTGVYSIMKDEWTKKPEYESINIPDGNIKRKSKPFKEIINDLIKNGDKNPENSINQIKKLKKRIKNFRQSGLDKKGEYSLENLAFKDLRNTGYLDKLSQLSNDLVDKQLSLNEGTENNIFEKFMSYACQELNIENPPSFEIRTEFGEEQPSFGAYVPSDHHIFLNPSNRNIVDILRTLAHELVHAKQNELELLEPSSGDTGSDIENDANAIAGILMRDYGKNNPNIYNMGVINEQKNKNYYNDSPEFKGNSNPLNLKYIDTWHDGQDLAFKNKTKEAIKVMTQAAKEAKEFSETNDNDFAEFKYYLSTIDWLKGNYKTAEKYINDKEVINSRNDEVLKRLLQNKDKSYKDAYGADLNDSKKDKYKL